MFLKSFIVLLGVTALVSGSPVNLSTRTIDQATFNDLTFYFQYASSAYADSCASPNGNTLITAFNNTVTDTQGFIARDDNRREIVVALRGSSSTTDFLIDFEILLVPFVSPGVTPPAGSLAHIGFLTAWNSVAAQVLTIVRTQLAAHPGYSLVSTGHSLGGALSSLAGIALQQNFPNTPTRMFTYGQPRTFNPTGALFINQQFGENAFRAVHTTDGIPTIIPTILGYRHHGIEYWQNPDPASAQTTKKCAADGEDPTCSASIPSQGFNQAHDTYFGIDGGTAFC
ncbi:hypothetical protein D9758_008018 [Tetrapyrgos nigripes]|uniref:Fungal lipase-type domain-containing protein n=1 Tax=Tetrapyrgos nigripes TaxID=182062 RepID=A0A8H5D263_9AGAR|nr:hypothetical protein D9758_008018 [Tetrapyrgos nigripes]